MLPVGPLNSAVPTRQLMSHPSVLLLLVFTTGILGMTLWRSRQLKPQVSRIQHAAESIIRGDTSARVELNFGPLAGAGLVFNEMVNQVEQDIQALTSTQAELERLVATVRLTGVGNRRAFDQLTKLKFTFTHPAIARLPNWSSLGRLRGLNHEFIL